MFQDTEITTPATLAFEPHIPSIIFDALGGFPGLARIGASSFKADVNCLQFEVCAHLTREKINMVSILGFYSPIYFVFDVYLYNIEGVCLRYEFCLDKEELVEMVKTI